MMNCRLLLFCALIAVGPRDDAEHGSGGSQGGPRGRERPDWADSLLYEAYLGPVYALNYSMQPLE